MRKACGTAAAATRAAVTIRPAAGHAAAEICNPQSAICNLMKPRIAITVGDPAGIGPEVAAKASSDPRVLAVCEPILYTPPNGSTFAPGVLSAAAGRAAYEIIVRAVEDAKNGDVQAIATAPVNKEAFRLAGLPWSGHTDLLAHLTGAAHRAGNRSHRTGGRPSLVDAAGDGNDDRADGARAAALRQDSTADRRRR